jgi:RNA polymerase primary sigma factor
MPANFVRKSRHKFISDKAGKRGLPMISDANIAAYLKDIGNINPLTREEEELLGRKIAKGNKKAVDELVKHNLKYVVTVANKYRGCGISLCDLINDGNIGLIHSAHKFDSTRKVKFITYAVWWIRQSIMHAIARHSGSVRLPIKQVGISSKVDELCRKMLQSKNREPTMEELGTALGLPQEELEAILRVYRTHLSLNTPIKDQIANSYLDFIMEKEPLSMESGMIQKDLSAEMLEILKELPERESLIIKLRFGFDGAPMTLEEIGKITCLSRERVRQIEKRAKENLRSKSKTQLLKEYLD